MKRGTVQSAAFAALHRPALSVAFSPDGTQIVSGALDQTIRFWYVASGRLLITLDPYDGPVHSVAFSPDGTRVASGSDARTIRRWDADSGELLTTYSGHEDAVEAVAFSPDGTRIVSGSRDNTIRCPSGLLSGQSCRAIVSLTIATDR